MIQLGSETVVKLKSFAKKNSNGRLVETFQFAYCEFDFWKYWTLGATYFETIFSLSFQRFKELGPIELLRRNFEKFRKKFSNKGSIRSLRIILNPGLLQACI